MDLRAVQLPRPISLMMCNAALQVVHVMIFVRQDFLEQTAETLSPASVAILTASFGRVIASSSSVRSLFQLFLDVIATLICETSLALSRLQYRMRSIRDSAVSQFLERLAVIFGKA